jgi:uncharacterized membrane protein YciS (DUF1049 family)
MTYAHDVLLAILAAVGLILTLLLCGAMARHAETNENTGD